MKDVIVILNDLQDIADSIAPLYQKYARQLQPQPAYIAIDICRGEIEADVNGEVGNGVPFSVWHGLVRRYRVPSNVRGSAIAAFLRSAEFQVLATRIVGGAEDVWDGNNRVGKLSDDAKVAEEELEALIRVELDGGDEYTHAQIWDADSLGQCSLTDYWSADKTLDEATIELEEGAKHERALLDVDVRDYLLDDALCTFHSRSACSLTEIHILTLLSQGRIDQDEAAEWRGEYRDYEPPQP
ncbi:hypothetical protein [Pseudomonas sp. BF-R-01]|uniref:hypothetical protein n=1 Tax=Pseudomonas sp. BF-R-01 TaxID=2832365 RepID=UPI001CBE2F2A|nr:hypothetical protein [Pseudomonas sp. BF-R-01]